MIAKRWYRRDLKNSGPWEVLEEHVFLEKDKECVASQMNGKRVLMSLVDCRATLKESAMWGLDSCLHRFVSTGTRAVELVW